MAFSPSHFLKKGFSSNSRTLRLGSSAGVSSGRSAILCSSRPSCSYSAVNVGVPYDLGGLERFGPKALTLGEGLLSQFAFFL